VERARRNDVAVAAWFLLLRAYRVRLPPVHGRAPQIELKWHRKIKTTVPF
jgi:hypothetical protein